MGKDAEARGDQAAAGAGVDGAGGKDGARNLFITWQRRFVSSYMSSWVAHRDPDGTKW